VIALSVIRCSSFIGSTIPPEIFAYVGDFVLFVNKTSNMKSLLLAAASAVAAAQFNLFKVDG
jgi:hypothetical protein